MLNVYGLNNILSINQKPLQIMKASTKAKLIDMFRSDFIPTGLTQEQQDARTDIYMQCRKIMKREIREEERKAREEQKKRQRSMSIKVAYVSKKNRKQETVQEELMSTSSAESRRYREQMKIPDLSGLPMRPEALMNEEGKPALERIGGAISSVASEKSEERNFDQSFCQTTPKFEAKSRNKDVKIKDRYQTTTRTQQEETSLEIIPRDRSGKEFLIVRLGQNQDQGSTRQLSMMQTVMDKRAASFRRTYNTGQSLGATNAHTTLKTFRPQQTTLKFSPIPREKSLLVSNSSRMLAQFMSLPAHVKESLGRDGIPPNTRTASWRRISSKNRQSKISQNFRQTRLPKLEHLTHKASVSLLPKAQPGRKTSVRQSLPFLQRQLDEVHKQGKSDPMQKKSLFNKEVGFKS